MQNWVLDGNSGDKIIIIFMVNALTMNRFQGILTREDDLSLDSTKKKSTPLIFHTEVTENVPGGSFPIVPSVILMTVSLFHCLPTWAHAALLQNALPLGLWGGSGEVPALGMSV